MKYIFLLVIYFLPLIFFAAPFKLKPVLYGEDGKNGESGEDGENGLSKGGNSGNGSDGTRS